MISCEPCIEGVKQGCHFQPYYSLTTVNSKFFARGLFSRKFRENKILTNWRNNSVAYVHVYG